MTSKSKAFVEIVRCPWAKNELSIRYHDMEWGVPQHDDRVLFEFLVLEGAQAGLSWGTILRKRENYRAAFDNFDPKAISRYGQRKMDSLMRDEGIILGTDGPHHNVVKIRPPMPFDSADADRLVETLDRILGEALPA